LYFILYAVKIWLLFIYFFKVKSPAVIYVRLRDGRTLDIKAKTNYHIDPVNWDDAEGLQKKAMKKTH
jgi:hypothetical protein